MPTLNNINGSLTGLFGANVCNLEVSNTTGLCNSNISDLSHSLISTYLKSMEILHLLYHQHNLYDELHQM